MRRRLKSTALALLLGIAGPSFSDAGVEKGAEADGPEQVRVELRMLDFLVLDGKGRPVVDLRREEVELRIDGRPRDVVDLLPAHDRERGHPRSSMEQPASGDSPASGEAAAGGTRRWIVFLFDANTLSLQGRLRAAEAVRQLVRDDIGSRDRVAVMVDEDDLRVPVPFTLQHDRVLSYLEHSGGMTGQSRSIESRLDDLRRDTETCRDARNRVACAEQATRNFIFETSRETERSLEHLSALLRSLAAIPERKILFYISEGFLVNPGDVATAAVQHAIGQSGYNVSQTTLSLMRDYSHRADEIQQLATQSRTGIYPVNTLRKMTDDLFSPERTLEGGPENLPQLRADPLETTWQQVRAMHESQARASGGVAVFQRDPSGHLDRALNSSAGVYTIFYRPEQTIPRAQRIKIKISRPRIKARFSTRLRPPREARIDIRGELSVEQTEDDLPRGVVRARLEVPGAPFRRAPETETPISIASVFFELLNADHERVQSLFEMIEFPREEPGDPVNGMLQRPFALRLPPGDYVLEVQIADVHGAARGSFERRFSVDSANRLTVEPRSPALPR